MTRASWPDLPALLAEIADIAGIESALAVARAKGGQEVFIASRLDSSNWLVQAVGLDKAKLISQHFCSGRSRQKLSVPLGPAGGYLAERRRRAKLMREAVEQGASANEIAAAARVTNRTARRFRSRLNSDQPDLLSCLEGATSNQTRK